MAIGTSIKVSLDTKAIARGFAKIKAGFSRLSSSVKAAGRAMLAPFVKMMAVLAPLLGAAGFARGIKDVIDYGGAVSDMANRLSVAASDIVFIEEVFRRTGATGKDVATTLQRMAKNIGAGFELATSEAGKALEELGLKEADLEGLNMAERFYLVGEAIAAMSDASKQARVSMAIFGREGASLINTFKDRSAWEIARKSIGGLGDNLDESANKLDHISDAFGAFTLKMRQFFAGVMNGAMPVLEDLADKINEIDLSMAGQKVGDFIKVIRGLFQRGTLGETVLDSLKYAALRFGEIFLAVLEFGVQQTIKQLADAGVPGIKDPTEARLVGTAKEIGGVIVPTGFAYKEGSPMKTMSEIMASKKGLLGSGEALSQVKGQVELGRKQASEKWLQEIGWHTAQTAKASEEMARKMKPAGAFNR